MRNLLLVALVVLFSLAPEASRADLLPVISIDRFSVGQQWTWDYVQNDGSLYSTERYTVIAKSGSIVVIEMSSDYNGGQSLKSHHRIEVDIEQCLGAYRNPVAKKAWGIRMFYFENGKWLKVGSSNTLAFEEKFNCNPFEFSKKSDRFLTVYSEFQGEKVFQQKLWKKLESTWFRLEGPSAGVGLRKDFMNGPVRQYSMRLRN